MHDEDQAHEMRLELDAFDASLDRMKEKQRSVTEKRDDLRRELAELECPFQVGDCYQQTEKYLGGSEWHPETKTREVQAFISSIVWNSCASWSWNALATKIKKDGTPYSTNSFAFREGDEWTKLPGRMVDGKYEENAEEGLTPV